MASNDRSEEGPEYRAYNQPGELYVGLNESIARKLFIDPADPRAAGKRRVLHWLFLGATTFFAAGGLALIVIMIVALARS